MTASRSSDVCSVVSISSTFLLHFGTIPQFPSRSFESTAATFSAFCRPGRQARAPLVKWNVAGRTCGSAPRSSNCTSPAGDCQQEATAAAATTTRGSAVIELVYTNGTRCASTHKPTDSLTRSVFQAIVCAVLSFGDTAIYRRTQIRRVHQSVPDAKF